MLRWLDGESRYWVQFVLAVTIVVVLGCVCVLVVYEVARYLRMHPLPTQP